LYSTANWLHLKGILEELSLLAGHLTPALAGIGKQVDAFVQRLP
jgi:hypothetical protein